MLKNEIKKTATKNNMAKAVRSRDFVSHRIILASYSPNRVTGFLLNSWPWRR
jgi:hypothetical protein